MNSRGRNLSNKSIGHFDMLRVLKAIIANAFPVIVFANTITWSTGELNLAIFWGLSTLFTISEWYYHTSIFASIIFSILRIYIAQTLCIPPFHGRKIPVRGRLHPRKAFAEILSSLPQPEDRDCSSPSTE